MADSKITALTAISTVDPTADPLVIVDVSDTSMAASGTTKKSTINQLLGSGGTATLASATITGDLTVDTSTLKVDSANNRVGVGTASPATALQVAGEIRSSADISNSSDTVLYSYNGGTAGTVRAGIQLIGSTPEIRSYLSGTTAITLNSTGLGVGGSPLDKFTVVGNSFLRGAAAGVRIGDGGGYGFISAYDQTLSTPKDLVLQTGGGNVGIGVTPAGTGGCLQLKSGITFPATQVASSDANTLDDYEEGTWSPVITAGSGTPTTVTVNSAVYTKIGRVVVCTFDISIVNKGTASSSLQFGLPFNSITSTAFCGSFREDGSTGNMGMVFYSTGTTAACLLYNNATPWVDGYRIKGTYTYFAS